MRRTDTGQEGTQREELLRTRAWDVEKSPSDLGYRVVPGWPQIPEGWELGDAAGVAVDSEDRTYVFHRGEGGIRKRGHGAPPLGGLGPTLRACGEHEDCGEHEKRRVRDGDKGPRKGASRSRTRPHAIPLRFHPRWNVRFEPG